MGWVQKQVTNVTDSVSKVIGTDGSNQGLLQGSLQGASDVVSGLGQQIADDPLAQMAISAAGQYFGVPASMTAALLAANSTGQKGDITAGFRAGALSLGTAAATNYLTDPSASLFGSSGTATTATTAEGAANPVNSFAKTVSETLGLGEDSKIAQTLNSVYEKVNSVGGGAIDKVGNVIEKVGTWAEANPVKAMTALQAVGGAYTASANREAADRANQAAMERLQYSNNAEKENNAAYMGSFNLANAAKGGPNYSGPLRRKDGNLVFRNYGLPNRG